MCVCVEGGCFFAFWEHCRVLIYQWNRHKAHLLQTVQTGWPSPKPAVITVISHPQKSITCHRVHSPGESALYTPTTTTTITTTPTPPLTKPLWPVVCLQVRRYIFSSFWKVAYLICPESTVYNHVFNSKALGQGRGIWKIHLCFVHLIIYDSVVLTIVIRQRA